MALCRDEMLRRRRANQKRRLILEDTGEETVGVDLPDLAAVTGSIANQTPAQSFNQYIWGFALSWDGMHVTIANEDHYVRSYPLSTAWDLSTVGALEGTSAIFTGGSNNAVRSIGWSDDGLKLMAGMYYSRWIREDNLTTAYDVTEVGGFEDAKSSTFVDNTMGVWFLPGGEYFSYVKGNSDDVAIYKCTTPWDVTDITLQGAASTTPHSCLSAIFSSDGTRLWMNDYVNTRVVQYTLSTPFNANTISADAGATYDYTIPYGGKDTIQMHWYDGALYTQNYDVTLGDESILRHEFV